MNVKIGDVYVRDSDGKVYRVKRIDNKKIVLESDDSGKYAITDIFVLEKRYTKKEPTH